MSSLFLTDNTTDITALPKITLKFYRIHKGMSISLRELGFLITIMVLCASFNTRCIYKLYQRKRLRSIDYLLGNLSFSVIFVCCIGTILSTNMITFLPLSPQGKCSVSNYLKYLSGSLASTASFAVSYERLSSLDRSRTRKRRFTLTTCKLVSLVWMSGVGVILPTLLTSVSPPDSLANVTSSTAPCWRVPLFYSKFLDIWYELVKYVFLHLAFTVCVFTELYMVRSKLKYLWKQQRGNLKSKVNRVRYAVIQSVLFIVLWNAVGLSNVVYTICTWYSFNNQLILSTLLGLMRGVGYIYSMINPMLLVYSNQSPKFWPIKCSLPSCFSKHNLPVAIKDADGALAIDDDKTHENENASDFEISRFATHNNLSSESTLNNKRDPKETSAIKMSVLQVTA